MASASTSRQNGGPGPIRTLARTFSSGGTSVTTAPLINVSSTMSSSTLNAAPQLPASAYNFDFDEDDEDDWGASLDLSAASTTSTSTLSTSNASVIATTSTKATLQSATAGKKSATGFPNSPRRPAMKSTYTENVDSEAASSHCMPLATQVVNIPTLPRMPNGAGTSKKTNGSSSWAPSRTAANAKPLSPVALSNKSMLAPFSKNAKPGTGQMSLSSFHFKATNAEASTSSSSSRKRDALYDLGAEKPSKVPRGESAGPDSDVTKGSSRSKSKGPGIGSLNVRQQIVLSTEQREVLKMVVDQRKSVFFTGSAGTGKSILLREIIKSLRTKYASRGSDRVAITASTGMAAANIGGTTIHSFGGIGLGQGTGEQLIEFVKKNKKATGRWLRTEVLIIDEVSMLDGDLFDKLEHIAKRFRRKPDKPFGGIQLIMTGDFFQLPPVTKFGQPKFAFEAKTWKDCVNSTVNLTKVFRQKDTEFIDMLNEMRFGKLSQASIVKFGKLKRLPKYEDGLEPTELFPLREQVDSANRQRLAALEGEEVVFKSIDEGEEPHDKLMKTLENVMAPRLLTLKLGAQVMLLKNMDNGLVNGSVGRVEAFMSAEEMANEGDEDEDEDAQRARQALRALSAVPSEDGDVKPSKKSKSAAYSEKAPVVLWKLPDGGTLRMRMVREEFRVDDVGDKVKARRKQYPMICAWAMSIHKSQGQTLDRVKCDLGRIFEKGQAYVALSRATSLDGLQVLNFNATKVLAHPKVVEWTKTLTTLS